MTQKANGCHDNVFYSGQSAGAITLDILPDDLPETDEELTIVLTKVEPVKTQRLLPGSTEMKVVIMENDNAGGVFQFGAEAETSYVVKVRKDTLFTCDICDDIIDFTCKSNEMSLPNQAMACTHGKANCHQAYVFCYPNVLPQYKFIITGTLGNTFPRINLTPQVLSKTSIFWKYPYL